MNVSKFLSAACTKINEFRLALENVRMTQPVQVEKISEILEQAFSSLNEGLNTCSQNSTESFETTNIAECIQLLDLLQEDYKKTLNEQNAKIQTIEDKIKTVYTILFILHKNFNLISLKYENNTNELSKTIESIKEVFSTVKQSIEEDQRKIEAIQVVQDKNALWAGKVKEIKKQISVLNEQVEGLFQQTGNAGQQLTVVEGDYIQMENDLEGVNQQLTVDEEKVADILAVVKEHVETIKGLEQELNNFAEELDVYDEDVAQAGEGVDALKKEIGQHIENVEEVHQKLEKISQRFDKVEDKLDDLIEQEKNLDPEEKNEHWLKKLLMKWLNSGLELFFKLADGVIRGGHWCATAYKGTATDLSLGVNKVSAALRDRIAPLVGQQTAEMVASPVALVGGATFLLYRAQLLKPALLCLCVGSLAYQAAKSYLTVQNPVVEV